LIRNKPAQGGGKGIFINRQFTSVLRKKGFLKETPKSSTRWHLSQKLRLSGGDFAKKKKPPPNKKKHPQLPRTMGGYQVAGCCVTGGGPKKKKKKTPQETQLLLGEKSGRLPTIGVSQER